MIDFTVAYVDSEDNEHKTIIQSTDSRAAIKQALFKFPDAVRVVLCQPIPPDLDEPSY